MKIYIGIDLGTSGCRAVAIDETATIRASASRSLPKPETPLQNQHQQDPEIWWQVLCEVLTEIARVCSEESPVAIAVDGTSSTLLLADHQGNPLTPALMYNDNRSHDALPLLEGIAPDGSPVLSPSSSLAKLLHLRRKIATDRYRALHQADWIVGRLCGDYRHSDENNVLKMGYDPISRAWPTWLAELQLPDGALPEVVPSASPVGRLCRQAAEATSLPPGIAIVAGTTDGNAAFLATGARDIGEAVTSLGSTLVVKILSEEPVFAAEYGVYSHRLGARWLVSGASNSGGAVLASFFSCDEMARMTRDLQPQRATGLDYYPLLAAGERFPVNDPDYPPRLQPRPANDRLFFQGMLEGIANIEAEGYRLLQRLGAARLKHVYSVGGGAKNEPWRQIRQQRLQVPVIPAAHHEAAYGTALLAMHGVTE
ncbi:MAG: carbohydrate kinase [gamma proteobacterium symbiont of Ctena orbiculata]|uniref:FGGY-family carbohydrate kinase n=1 Tax=Candidatus Thiodiazotropha taylori TaxID=2792791 RepID=A0A944M921_9GAMM|nr:FGGY-family carbohydrate kinase [Candidatus Thiodiazotropha taylori]MBV2138518.1 FGGY-family carbohydrate kinase [Candidatus Thiodiazotropha taylori]PVV13460.1 MAG: carbohydrate kinase [gamma proteobacterium symbiont of Ctena orbiculata]PVV14504.1 MAG: carbohydrate kinase [gamma proteobacterium symbiont of Ctena orbiculata]PVV20069.1 MAG: carbohydrate kinase [gamma proteobacterium symbiont of Ctena orbiculata]